MQFKSGLLIALLLTLLVSACDHYCLVTHYLTLLIKAGQASMSWKSVMNLVKGDPRFYEETDENNEPKPAGWQFLQADDNDDGNGHEDDGDEDYSAGDYDDSDDDEEEEEEEEEEEDDEEDVNGDDDDEVGE